MSDTLTTNMCQWLSLSLSFSLSLSAYPSSANPIQAPVVTQIGIGTRYMINISNSIPSSVSGDLGYSTLIVRVHDLSSTTQDDFTYYVLVSDSVLFNVLHVLLLGSIGGRKMDLNLIWHRLSVGESTYHLLLRPIRWQYQATHHRLC